MRKIFKSIALVAVAAASLVSCNKEVKPVEPIEKEYTYTFTLSNTDTKAILATEGDDTFTKWESGDQLGVYTFGESTGTSYNRYGNINTGVTPVQFQISSYYALGTGDKVYCYFPYDANNSKGDAQNPTKVTLTIPTSQNGKMNAMPMVSVPYTMTSSVASQIDKPIADINMRNLGGVFQFNIFSSNAEYQTETIEKVEFKANAAIAGTFVYDITQEGLSAISGLSEESVAVECQNLAITANTDDASKVLMVVAPGSHRGSLVVTTNKAVYTLNFSSAKQVDRSHIKPLNVDLNKAVSREPVSYMLYFEKLDNTTPYNNYTAEHSYTYDGVNWNIYGNQTQGENLRIGGKRTSATDRTITSTNIIPGCVSTVVINHNGLTNATNTVITVNSLTIEASSSSSFPQNSTDKVTVNSPSLSVPGELELEFNESHSDCYYRITVNYVTAKVDPSKDVNNSYLTINTIKFFDDSRTPQTLSFTPGEVTYDIYNHSSFVKPALSGAHTPVTYTSSDSNVADVDNDGNLTVKGISPVAGITITATAAADATYKSAKVSYTLKVVDSTPKTNLEEPSNLQWNAETKVLSWDDTNTGNGTYGTNYKYQYSVGDEAHYTDASSATGQTLTITTTKTVYVKAVAITVGTHNSSSSASKECEISAAVGSPWSFTFTNKDQVKTTNTTNNGLTFKATTAPGSCETTDGSTYAARGLTWASGNSTTITISGYSGKIEKVVLYMSTNGSSSKVKTTIGSTALSQQAITSGTANANKAYVFEPSPADEGNIVIEITNSSSKSTWLKKIEINPAN